MSSSRGKYIFGCFIIVAATIVIVPILVIYLGTSGLVHGEEFSPDDFSRRYFTYNVMPIIDYPILGISHSVSTPTLEQLLVSDGLITAQPVTKWDLIYDTGFNEKSPDYDARFLTHYLDMQNSKGENFWTIWNEDFPDAAKIFWPAIADLARSRMYWAIPEIMRFAKTLNKESLDEFVPVLNQMTAKAFYDEGITLQSEEKHELAIDTFTKSIGYSESKDALKARGSSYAQIGKLDESKADRQAASELSE